MVSLYDLSIPIYVRALSNLIQLLKKGEEWATDNKVEQSKLVEARIYSDMKPLSFQVQSASDTSKAIFSRIAGKESPKMEDNETTFEQLYDRLQRTIEALETLKREDIDGKEDIEVSMMDGKIKFSGLEYFQKFALPNFFFHVTTAYDILRKEGVPVGKLDFLGRNL